MPNWMDELDELTKGMKGRKPPEPEYDDEEDEGAAEGDGDGDSDDEEYSPPGKMKKAGKSGPYPAADNGDDDDEGEGANTDDADVMEKVAPQRGGKKQKKFPTSPKQVTKSVRDYADEETEAVIDASPALEALVKAIDSFGAHILGQVNKSLKAVRGEVEAVTEGQAIIGRAVAKGLTGNQAILKSLAGEVEELAKTPRPRKAVAKAVEKQFAAGQTPEPQLDRQQIMAKSLEALQAGRINVHESASVDAYMNKGRPLPPVLLAKILGPKP